MAIIMNNWPFGENEAAKIYWISSPYRNFKGDMMVNVTLELNRKFKNIERAWGELAFLGTGLVCQRNYVRNVPSTLDRYELQCTNIKKQELMMSNQIPKNLFCTEKYKIYTNDCCTKLTANGITYIIPCVEIVRAIAGTNPFFLNKLLTSDSLTDFSSCSINNNVISMELCNIGPHKFPSALRTKYMIREYTNFLFNSELHRWWEAVNADFLSALNLKIKAKIPMLEGSTITGQGIRNENIVLLLHIVLEHLPNLPYRINVLHFTPKSRTSSKASAKVHPYEGSSGDNVMQAHGSANSSSVEMQTLESSSRYDNSPNISYIYKDAYTGLDSHTYKKISNKEQTVSAQDTILGGKNKGVVITPLPTKSFTLPSAFELLQNAFSILIQDNFLRITKIMAKDSLNDYVIVLGYTTYGYSTAILEFCQAEGRNISTLILVGPEDCEMAITKLLRKLQNGIEHRAVSALLAETQQTQNGS